MVSSPLRVAIVTAPSVRRKPASAGWQLLDPSYFHVVFTVPHELNVLALENPRLFYDLLFTATAQTLLKIASDVKHLGAEIAILHTWGQNLLLHPHIHCVIPEGGLSPDHHRWVRPRYPFFLPVRVLSRVFRGKFLAGLKRLHRRKKLQCAGPARALADPRQFAQLLRRLHRHDWVVYAKPAFSGPRLVTSKKLAALRWVSPTTEARQKIV